MSFGPNVGMSFHEAMSGTLLAGFNDPAKAEKHAAGRPINFKFNVLMDIASLRAFLNAPTHVAKVMRGMVSWEGLAAPGTPIMSGGTIQMYRNVSQDGKHKDFKFTFAFRTDDGRIATFNGTKEIKNDPGLDVFEDLSRVSAKIQIGGQTVAAGVTSVHFDELWDQIISMRVHRAPTVVEEGAARTALFSFMNSELRQVFPDLPNIFHLDDRRFLRPSEWRAVAFAAQAMLPQPLPPGGPTVDETVANIQELVRQIPTDALDEIRQLLRLIGTFTPFTSPKHVREALEHFVNTGNALVMGIANQLKLVAAVPYYAHPKADAIVNYVRPTFRSRDAPFKIRGPLPGTRLHVTRVPSTDTTYDVIIVGSGVAGAILADRASAKGQRVLVLEAGSYHEEQEMSSDEIKMTARLYKGAGLQLTKEGMTILQGACVGGGGVVNNAICFQLPSHVYARWQTAGFPITNATLRAAYKATAAELGIKPVSKAASHLNPAKRFLTSLGAPKIPEVDQEPPEGLSECLVNLSEHCEGLGLCNTGCGNERKNNAFQVHLKRALATGRVTLVPDANVKSLLWQGQDAVRGVLVDVGGSEMEIKGGEVILAAGAIGSSGVLLRSGIAQRRPDLPVGKRFTANVGCPAYVVSKKQLHARPSLQISHAFFPKPAEGYVIEAWYSTPAAVALTIPGFFDQHFQRMKGYDRMTVLAALVGSRPVGRVTVDGGVTNVTLNLNADLDRIVDGAADLAKIVLDSNDPDFDHIILGTLRGHEVRTSADIANFKSSVHQPADLRLGTGHPQGGNAMSTTALGVVDDNFKVRGMKNLRVCDASVFPAVAGVNPQWTVMALAHICGASL